MIHEALRLIRVFHNTKLVDLAREIEVSPSYLSEIERGKKKPSLELVGKYAKVFKTKPSVILFFSEDLDKEKGRGSFQLKAREKFLKLLTAIEHSLAEDLSTK